MIGVDLGTTHVRVHVKGRGVVLREPAVIAMSQDTGDVMAIGEEAYKMLGRTPGSITAVRPMQDGVIADYTLTEKMLKGFVGKVLTGPSRFLRPTIMVCVPSEITDVERRAVLQAVHEIGARKALLIEEPVAAAIGAGIDIAEPVGAMVIDMGGGTTDVAILSLGGIVNAKSVRVAGNAFDADVAAFVKEKHELLIGDRTAEQIKREVGAAMLDPDVPPATTQVRGRGLIDGMPKTATVTSTDVVEAIEGSLEKIAETLRKVLETAEPELVSDVIDRGIVLTGGAAQLRHVDRYLSAVSGIPVGLAEDPEDCVVVGTSRALDMADVLEDARRRGTEFH
ncbi:MAG: rod shape-determining protein [Trueperaceae bacterium]|nr:rod shape-determining protein [Trueperaceae bacterium]